jgi:CubicO group peptidase (beta-lactamase class C family)
MQATGVPGASVAVIKDFKLLWAKGYGTADVATGKAVDTKTRFQAGSISKPVSALAVLTLAQRGRLSIDDDVNSLLKSWHVPRNASTGTAPVTLRALLSHTSGADDGLGFPGYAQKSPLPTLVQILDGAPPANTRPVTFARPVFSGHKYSGGGYQIVQLALTDFIGAPYPQIVAAQVLEPLGMSNSSYDQPPSAAHSELSAQPHNRDGAVREGWHIYPEQAAAGLWTTPTDLAKFVLEIQQALRGPRGHVLQQSAAREMITPTGTGPFAVGLRIERRGEGWYFQHGGDTLGFRARLIGHVRKGYAVIIMANSETAGDVVNEIEARVALEYGWDSLDKPIPR